MNNPLQDIRIGTIVLANNNDPARYIAKIIDHGFESFQLNFWQTLGNADLQKMAADIQEIIGDRDVAISALGMYGNPLECEDINRETLQGWEILIDNAHLFGTDIVAGFTGRVCGKPLDESLPRFQEVFDPLAARAAEKGIRLAFENCPMDGSWKSGDWNIAHNPAAWERMFNLIDRENVGLEWEPCHQLYYLMDPMQQLRTWVPKIFHVHGKDCTVHWDVIRTHGIHGPVPFAFHRTPGFGDSNWTEIISELRRGGFKGVIDIEGWHDPVYRADLEMTGQVRALHYLKECRGGTFVPNPTAD